MKINKLTKTFFLLTFIFLTSSLSVAQNSPKADLDKTCSVLKLKAEFNQLELNRQFSVKELKEDFQILRSNLETVHAGLYTYTGKEDFDKAFRKMKKDLDKPMSSIEFYRRISCLNQLIQNVHTQLLPSAEYRKAVSTEFRRFPFTVYWDSKSLFVLENLSLNDSIIRGSKIKTINGDDATQLFIDLANKFPRDGKNTTLPQARTATNFGAHYTEFIGIPEFYDVELVTPKGEIQKLKIKALRRSKQTEIRTMRYGNREKSWVEKKEPAITFGIKGKTATLKVRSFSNHLISRSGQNFNKVYKKAFKQIKQKDVTDLILDLRGNEGGNTTPTVKLFSYLHDKPFTPWKDAHLIIDKIPNENYFNNDGSFTSFSTIPLTKIGNVFRRSTYSGLREHSPEKNNYKGRLYVLTDAFSASASGDISGLLKNVNRAVFVGEESGGNQNENVSGLSLTLVLPNTKNRVVIPTTYWKLNVNYKNTGHGVIPHYKIKPSIENIINEKDPIMEFTLDLIKKVKQ